MNSSERVVTALNRQEPDRVPTFEWEIDHNIIQSLTPNHDYFDFVEEMDLDAVVIGPDYKSEQIDENTYIDEWKVVKRKGHEEYLIPLEDQAPIRSIKDFKHYSPPDPITPERFATLRKAVERFKGKRAIIIKIRDALSTPRDIRGYTGLLMDLKLEPNLVKEMVDLSIHHNLEVGLEAIKIGADIVVTGDDYADNSGPLMSPKLFNEFFFPGIRKLINSLKEAGAYFIKHTDGNITLLIDMFIEANIDCIDPIDPLAGMDILEIKRKYGSKVAIKGNIDCVNILSNSPKTDVVMSVLDCILKASPNGGHIISSSNSIHSGVKPENYKAMLEAIFEYGQYPINVKKLEKILGSMKSSH